MKMDSTVDDKYILNILDSGWSVIQRNICYKCGSLEVVKKQTEILSNYILSLLSIITIGVNKHHSLNRSLSSTTTVEVNKHHSLKIYINRLQTWQLHYYSIAINYVFFHVIQNFNFQ